MARAVADAGESPEHPGYRINSRYREVIRRYIDTDRYVYVDIQRAKVGAEIGSRRNIFLDSPVRPFPSRI